MADVDDAEDAEMERLIRGSQGGTPPPPSSPTISNSAPRLDAPSPLPTATIDLTSDISPPASLSMVASATSGHV